MTYVEIAHLKIFWNIWNKFYSIKFIDSSWGQNLHSLSIVFARVHTVNASKHSHFTVRLESLKEKRQALPWLSQFSKTTLNESTSRDSHLTVLHAFRPVNEQQKVTPVDLALVNTTCTPAAAWPDSLVSMAVRIWSTFSFLLCYMHGQQMLPLRIMIKKEVINTRCNHFLRPQNVKLT